MAPTTDNVDTSAHRYFLFVRNYNRAQTQEERKSRGVELSALMLAETNEHIRKRLQVYVYRMQSQLRPA